MYLQNILKTIVAKSGILALNFVIVICTTRFWGAEGRGMISILMANLAIIVTVNNIFSGSSIAFHISGSSARQLLKPAIYWVVIASLIVTLIFTFSQKNTNPIILFLLAIITSLTTFNLSVFVGKEKMNLFNIYNFLLPLFTLIFLLILYYCKINTSKNSYFIGYGIAFFIVWIISFKNTISGDTIRNSLPVEKIKSIFNYGLKNELSYFLQFLNYRLSFYFILYYLGYSKVGLFSIAIAIAESVWIISNSISVVHYSKVLNTADRKKMTALSNKSALISLMITSVIGLILIFIPAIWFEFIFGKGFALVKPIILLLYPGVLFMAFSNIYGHYLSATGQMAPLIIKSALGLVATILFSFLLIPRYGITGACIATICSHLISSGYICWSFFRIKIVN